MCFMIFVKRESICRQKTHASKVSTIGDYICRYKISRFVRSVRMLSNANETIEIRNDIWNVCDVVKTTTCYIIDILQICVFVVKLVLFGADWFIVTCTHTHKHLISKYSKTCLSVLKLNEFLPVLICEAGTLWFVTNKATCNIIN